MISRIGWMCVLSSAMVWAQAAPRTNATSPQNAESGETKPILAPDLIGMNEAVLTIKGFCPERKNAGQPCETVITRGEFEKMTAAIRPNLSASVKQQFANLYPRLLVMSKKAEEMGLDKEAPYEQMIAFSRMQILTQALTRKLQQDAAEVSEQEIADYYDKNAASFEEYTLERLVVPLRSQGDLSTVKPTSLQEFHDLAKTLRERAVAGEDFEKLQQAAYDAAGMKVASSNRPVSNTSMGKVGRSALPAEHAAIVADLKIGEVSRVITDSGGHYIYKLQGRERQPLEQAKVEIRHTLESQHVARVMDKVQGSYTTETNSAYFAVQPKRER
jgi:PPIC-type PPIASE domain